MPTLTIEVEAPAGIDQLRLPVGVQRRLQSLLDKQDGGTPLTGDERSEAQGLVSLAEWLSLLRLRASRMANDDAECA